MKLKLSYLFVLLAIISCQNNSNSKVEINSSKSISNIEKNEKSEEITYPEITILEYLSNNFNKLPDSTFIKKPDWMIVEDTIDIYCGYIIHFEEGHTFEHQQECVEWGEIITVKFKKYKPEEVRELVEKLFENKNYNWYNNKTEYRPKEYYERDWTFTILQTEESTDLKFSYSWI